MFRCVCLVLLGIASLVVGCDDEESPRINEGMEYVQPTTPENLIENLQVAYRRREIGEYAQLLAPEFRFKLQLVDQIMVGKEYMSRDDDSTGTRALFFTPEVAEIRIALLYAGRDTIVNTPGTPIDSVKIRALTTDLQVDHTDGITWVATDQQDMFFRKGISAYGENPAHWFMYEWHDLPTYGSPGFTGGGGETTWGWLKNAYPVGNKH